MTDYRNGICNALYYLLFLVAVFTFVRGISAHYEFLKYPYQLEYREGAPLEITRLYLSGQNPYTIESQPQSTFVYGFVYPLIVTPFAKIFGNTLMMHRAVTYAFIISACMLVFLVLLKEKVRFIFAFSAFVILHQSLINAPNTMLARPEGIGIFLMTLGIVIPWYYRFSTSSLFASIIIGMLAYFTKSYYIILIPDIAAYLFLFAGKKKSLYYLAASVIIFIIFNVAVMLVYPLYINNTFFIHCSEASFFLLHLTGQIGLYMRVHLFLFAAILPSALYLFWKYKSCIPGQNMNRIRVNTNFKLLNDEPVFKTKGNFVFVTALLINFLAFTVLLGGHVGNYYGAYLYHLVSPFLILVTFQIIRCAEGYIAKSASAVILGLAMLISFSPIKIDFQRFSECFRRIETEISNSRNVLNSPETVSIVLSQNKPVYNSGHTEYFAMGAGKMSRLLGISGGVSERSAEFRNTINDKVKGKEFDLILQTKDYDNPIINRGFLEQYYKLKDNYCAPGIYDEFVTEVWVRK